MEPGRFYPPALGGALRMPYPGARPAGAPGPGYPLRMGMPGLGGRLGPPGMLGAGYPRGPPAAGLGLRSPLAMASLAARPAPTPLPAAVAPKCTTVYVGKIAATVPEEVIRKLLEACGPIRSWKMMEDPETKKPKGFGFCEFRDAEGCLRAIRLLNNLKLDGQELAVKANSATQIYIEQYEQQKLREKQDQANKESEDAPKTEEGEEQADEEEGEVDQDTKILEIIMSTVSEREEIFAKNQSQSTMDQAVELLAKLEEKLPPPPEVEEVKAVVEVRDRDKEKEREKGKEKERALEREYEKERDRERRDERRRLQEAERLYEVRLKEWERCERDIHMRREKEKERHRELDRDRARAVRADLENSDTDDEVEPWMRRSLKNGRRMEGRHLKRQREEEEDELDRIREAEEEERAKRLHLERLAAEAEEQRASKERAEAAAAAAAAVKMEEDEEGPSEEGGADEPNIDPNDSIYKAMMAAAAQVTTASPAPVKEDFEEEQQEELKEEVQIEEKPQNTPSPQLGPVAGPLRPKMQKNRQAVMAMFGDDEDERKSTLKLIPLQYTPEELEAVNQQPSIGEDPKVVLRRIMDNIPVTKEGVFQYKVKWDACTDMVLGRIEKWVSKKIQELLGVEEPALVSFVLQLLKQHAAPSRLLEELASILDEEGDTFVLKLYRMVIYETEKEHLGLGLA